MIFKNFYFEEDQEISSAKTSIKQVAQLHNELLNKGIYKDGQVILDWGGGRFDLAKEKIESIRDVNFYVHDLFNRNPEHNKQVEEEVIKNGGADIITLTNVLNVIKEKEHRIQTLKKAKEFLKEDGKVYISVYNATRSKEYQETEDWVGQKTNNGWQNCQPLSFYVPEVSEVFSNVKKTGSMIIAEK